MVPRENRNNAYAKFGGQIKSITVFSEMAYWLEVADLIQCSGTCRKLWSLAPLTLPGPSRSCRTKASDDISFKYSFNRFIGHLSLF